jgi:ornithine cyclodeaminase/alanine dehydrogenase-like protein (mu-crystallin family)
MSGRADGPLFLGAAAVAELLPPAVAVDALEDALRAGLDPEADPPRAGVPAGEGELLIMPSGWGEAVGAKLVTVAPDSPGRTLPRVQGIHVLFDAETLAPGAVIDGAAFTALRTSAVSALALRHLAAPEARRLVLFGTGPQAWAHVEAIRAVRPVEQVEVLGRDSERLSAFVRRAAATGIDARQGTARSVADADLVCCCTTAAEPLFDGALPPAHCSVVAIGSHRPDAREVDERLVGRSTVVVEAVSSALREAGDIVLAVEAGACTPEGLQRLDRLVRGEVAVPDDRPRLFKSTGMSWEDAVLAEVLWRRAR